MDDTQLPLEWERAAATSRVCICPLTLGAIGDPPFEGLSLCVSLAEREFSLPSRERAMFIFYSGPVYFLKPVNGMPSFFGATDNMFQL